MSRSCASGSGTWMDHLPFVLLGLRTSIREDSACAPSDLLYGTSIRLPGDMLSCSDPVPAASDFSQRLRSVMGSSVPMPIAHHCSPTSRTDPALSSATHVFLRTDAVRRPLVPPYDGPFKILERSPKTFTILKSNKSVVVSVDRLKPAAFLPEAASFSSVPAVPPSLASAFLPPFLGLPSDLS